MFLAAASGNRNIYETDGHDRILSVVATHRVMAVCPESIAQEQRKS